MKTILLLLILLPSISFSQCKYLRDDVDKFTNDTIKQTRFNRLCYKGIRCFNYAFALMNGYKYLMVSYVSSSIYSVRDDAKLMLLMDDGSVINLNVIKGGIAGPSLSVWYLEVYLPLSDDNYDLLRSKSISTIRYFTADGYVELDTKPKNSNLFKKMLLCIES